MMSHVADNNPKGLTLEAGTYGTVIEKHRMLLEFSYDNTSVVYTTKIAAEKAGFSTNESTLIATAASELATNIIRYAKCGEVVVLILKHPDHNRLGIEILAKDEGNGIPDIEEAMRETFTTTKNSLGCGLPTVRRLMDEFLIESSVGHGTRIIARKWRRSS